MKKSKVIITIKDHGAGKIELACQCINGKSTELNEMANHIANKLPPSVQEAIMSFYNKEESKNVCH